MATSITVFVERVPDSEEFLAYCDEVQCMATGSSAEDAVLNFRAALRDLTSHFGPDVLNEWSRKTLRTVSLS